jgi:hypothetical protein
MNKALGTTLVLLTAVAVPQSCLAHKISQKSPPAAPAFAQNVPPASLDGPSVSLFTCEPGLTAAGEIPARSSAVLMGLAMADFTGDSHPDLVTVKLDRLDSFSAHYLIEIQLTEGSHQSLRLTGPPGGLFVIPKDVTGDGTLDLVVRVVGSQVPIAVFLNNGCGHFARGEPLPTSRKLQDSRSDSELTAANPGWPAPTVASGSYTVDCQPGSRRSVEGRRSSPLSRTNRIASPLFLQFCSNRAPPAIS